MKRLKVLTITVLAAAVLCACSGNNAEETTAAPETAEETTAAETEEETAATEAADLSDGSDYFMLQGVVHDISDDDDSFSLLCDDGVTREISVYDIGDMEINLEDGEQIAIACIGKMSDDLSGVKLIVALPEQEEWTFAEKTGVTTNNAMSAFGIETDDGETIQFLKDNCPIYDDALAGDEGDRVTVSYVISADGNFPMEIRPAADQS